MIPKTHMLAFPGGTGSIKLAATGGFLRPVILVCGVQGSGKSWVCRQLDGKFTYVAHDRCWSHPDAQPDPASLDPAWGPPGSKSTHLEEILKAAKGARPVITEVPFGETQLAADLGAWGVEVRIVFVVEPLPVLMQRYYEREGKTLSGSAVARAGKMRDKAVLWGAFFGTSGEVLRHLRGLKP